MLNSEFLLEYFWHILSLTVSHNSVALDINSNSKRVAQDIKIWKKKMGIFRNLGQVKNKSVLSHKIFFREALEKTKQTFLSHVLALIFFAFYCHSCQAFYEF